MAARAAASLTDERRLGNDFILLVSLARLMLPLVFVSNFCLSEPVLLLPLSLLFLSFESTSPLGSGPAAVAFPT